MQYNTKSNRKNISNSMKHTLPTKEQKRRYQVETEHRNQQEGEEETCVTKRHSELKISYNSKKDFLSPIAASIVESNT